MKAEKELLEMLKEVYRQIEELDEEYDEDKADLSSMSYTELRDRLDAIRDTLEWCLGNNKHLELSAELC